MKESFFQVVSISRFVEALKTFPRTATLERETAEAFGMVLAEPVVAAEDLPLMHRSCVDGYAVRAADTFGVSESNPTYLDLAFSVAIETPTDAALEPGTCARITTGGCLPQGADAVVMVEQTLEMGGQGTSDSVGELGGATIEVHKSLSPWDNVMLRGEDVQAGETLLQPGTRLDGARIGLLAALGYSRVRVYAPVTVGILSTGDEVVAVDQPVRPGLVRDVNSHTLAALAQAVGARAVRLGLVRDDLQTLTAALEKGLTECDVVLVSGGSSVGTRDHSLEALERLPGGEILAHGVAMSPGKPTILARTETDSGLKAVLGLPGQVASAQVVMQVLVLPFLAHLQGLDQAFDLGPLETVPARLSRNVASRQGRTDFVRVALNRDADGGLTATPVLGKSGLLKTLLQAQGLMEIPENREGFTAGTEVMVRPLV
ncbi:gephyrin-like molybdotransferase Glp [Desulfonatronum sp. SC1]|uniref:molybdopterin molybdotransferase MoeA n=1 Tax=Desulfonatronum sp. SC1 TaxID=2109626 RepID=UPI000D310094|nr:gephyrin-like molybdotransferase Glp [Desulfonatronum sp. SC1]PTN38218.1 molybdopterin molybdenumtransferase MoeA [Desulfonatronum sp. SC1]